MGGILIVAGVLLCLVSMPTDLDLPDVHPDETASETYEVRFSFGNAMEALERIRTALERPGEMDAEVRTIGYLNWAGAVEGTLRKQQLVISQLVYELAVERYKTGGVRQEEVDRAKREHEARRSMFLAFWERFSVAD